MNTASPLSPTPSLVQHKTPIMKPAKHRHTFLALASLTALAAGGLPLSAQTVTTVLNDTFADGERDTQNLPGSAKWMSSVSASLTVSGETLAQSGAGRTDLAYFTANGSPVNLAVDESLSLTFDVSFASVSNSTAGFRVGLFSPGTRVTADDFSAAFSDGNFGYIGAVNLAATSNNILRVYERPSGTANANLVGGSISGYTLVGTAGGGTFKTFAAGETYTAIYTLTRTAESSMSITLSYTGIFAGDAVSSTQTVTRSDSSGLTTSFDTLAFYNHTGTGYTLDNIQLDYTSTIPEPSTVALLLGGVALTAGVLIRRKRAA